jgi:hypothetical protein
VKVGKYSIVDISPIHLEVKKASNLNLFVKEIFLILVFPACGIDFALYEYLRRIYREKVTSLEEPSTHFHLFKMQKN